MFQAFGARSNTTYGDPIILPFVNRTGATLLKGKSAMIDITDIESEVTTIDEGLSTSATKSLTCWTQALYDAGNPGVVAMEDIADNATGNCCVWGVCDAAATDDDIGSITAVDKGDRMTIVIARAGAIIASSTSTTAIDLSVLGVGGAIIEAGATTARVVGQWWEDAAADSTVTAKTVDFGSHLRRCFWTGGIPCLSCKTA